MVERRALLALLLGSFALSVGCSGGGGGTGGSPPTPKPTATPTPVPTKSVAPTPTPSPTPVVIVTATPTAMPSAPPSGAAQVNATRPLNAGDTFAYAGTTQQNFVYGGASPSPAASTLYAVTQNVGVTGNASYNGASGLYDFKTAETDTSPLQKTTITTDTYYGSASGGAGLTDLLEYGYASSDSLGQQLAVTYTNPQIGPTTNGLIDVLPETSGDAWSNSGAQTIVESEADGFKATRTYAADGSFVENATYPQAGVAQPTAAPLTAQIATNADGSATYVLPLFGPPNSTVTYSAPAANGAITISLVVPGPNPTSTPAFAQTTTVSAWYQQPVKLYQELDRDNGSVALPAACNVPATYGATANEIEQKSVRVDPVLGTLESLDQLTYVGSTGVVCVQLVDRTLTYYDYSGQGNGSPTGISYSGGNTPLETATVSTTIGLTATSRTPFAVTRQSVARAVGTAASAPSAGLRLANARSNFLALVEHRRIAAQRRAYRALRTKILERTTR